MVVDCLYLFQQGFADVVALQELNDHHATWLKEVAPYYGWSLHGEDRLYLLCDKNATVIETELVDVWPRTGKRTPYQEWRQYQRVGHT